jgi:hypothetical protein
MYARVQRRTVHPIHSERKRDSSTQLPDPQRALERIARLVKPGGWLLLEEVSITGEVEGDAPAVRATYGLLVKYWETSGGDARFSEKLESTLRESSAFSEVNVHEVVAPVGSLAGPAGTHFSRRPPPPQNTILKQSETRPPQMRPSRADVRQVLPAHFFR